MTRRRLLFLPIACLTLVMSGVLTLTAQSGESIDLAALQRIKEEGLDRSQVMDIAWWLTDRFGPRLTNSPQMRAAADWSVKKMTEWGLANVKQEPWGSAFGRGWSNQRTVLHVVKPEPWPVLAYAKAWTREPAARSPPMRCGAAPPRRIGDVQGQAERQDRVAARPRDPVSWTARRLTSRSAARSDAGTACRARWRPRRINRGGLAR